METEILVVGGNVAGRGFVSSILKINPQTQITLVRRENKALVPCGIPYVFGTLKLPDNNSVSDESMVEKGVNILVDEVTAIDKERKLAVTASGEKLFIINLFWPRVLYRLFRELGKVVILTIFILFLRIWITLPYLRII